MVSNIAKLRQLLLWLQMLFFSHNIFSLYIHDEELFHWKPEVVKMPLLMSLVARDIVVLNSIADISLHRNILSFYPNFSEICF